MPLELVNEGDCSYKGGTRIIDREKLETKKEEKLRSKESTKKKTKDKYIYTIIWNNQQNRQKRTRIYLKNKDLGKVDIDT